MTAQLEVKKVKVGDTFYVIKKENGRTFLENPVHKYEIVRRLTPKSRKVVPTDTTLKAKDKKQRSRCKALDLTYTFILINCLYSKEVLKKS